MGRSIIQSCDFPDEDIKAINEIDDPFFVIVAAKSDSIKKILYFEVCSLIIADEDIRPEEQQVLIDITRKFEIEPDRSSPDLCVNYLSQNIELTDLGNLVLLLDWIGLTPLKVVVHIQVPSAGGPFFVEFHEQGTK